MKDALRYYTIIPGAQYVMITGGTVMLKLVVVLVIIIIVVIVAVVFRLSVVC